MKAIMKSILCLFLLSSFSSALAIDAPSNIKLEDATESSLTISWDQVEGAAGYYLYISTNVDEIEFGDTGEVYEGTEAIIENLEANTKYYISLTSIDYDINESDLSPVNSFNTTSLEEEQSYLKLESVETIYSDEYILTFNNKLNSTPDLPREIKIINKADEFAEYEIIETNIENNTLNIKTSEGLEANTEYEMVVVELYDIDLNTIGKGVNASVLFTTPENFEPRPSIEENTIIEETINTTEENTSEQELVNNTEENNIDLNAASEEPVNEDNNNLSENQNTFETAHNAEKLPQTGPAAWLLLALALFFGLISLTFKLRKS